ncbi:hypothetical protein RAS1_12680 [Phycisphaerae bacterium RAS1]|nr:hypothetical protein RAS1_12680 [Phycisphaerae bacterium RAS1]
MSRQILLDVELPADLDQLRLPHALDRRLQALLDRQDQGDEMSDAERSEAEGLVNLAEFLSLLRLRIENSDRKGRAN